MTLAILFLSDCLLWVNRWVAGENEKLPAILRDLSEQRVAVLATPEYRNRACRQGSDPDYPNCFSRRGGPGRHGLGAKPQHAGR